MPSEVAKYQFQSWARKGISAHINEQDTLGNATAVLPPSERASVPIGVSINATPQTPKNFALIGPGDIIGIHQNMVVRSEPRNRTTNFEPNYLAFIEFYDEDFPWRYTPARPQGESLRPWICLLVLKEGEFERDNRRMPLPVIKIKSKDVFPPSDETWLFAHVHTEQDIAPDQISNLEAYLISLREVVTTDPDKIYSRLLSPRHLEPNQSYQAFLVPTFEVGRLAGLDQPTVGISAQKPAWDATTTGIEMPVYFDWQFNTGEKVDFESLVELLEPQVLDEQIGRRSMDCAVPGFVQVDSKGLEKRTLSGEIIQLPPPEPLLQGLEGALKTDRTEPLPPHFTANRFQVELEILVNLPETLTVDISVPAGPPSDTPTDSDEDFLNDPIVSVPFYGQNHARQHKKAKVLLDTSKEGWYNDLNRDPRTRVPAGFGTGVIQKHQEKFMQRAWQQVQKVYEANKFIRNTRFHIQVSLRYGSQFFALLEPAKLIAVTTPIHAKILGSPTTIRQQITESRLIAPVFSASFRRLVRPTGKLAQRLNTSEQPFDYTHLVTALNEGHITPAPPRAVPNGIPSVDELAQKIQPHHFPDWVQWLIENRLLLLIFILVLLFIAAMLTAQWALGVGLAVVSFVGFRWAGEQHQISKVADELTHPEQAKAAIELISPQPGFNVLLDGESAVPPAMMGTTADGDSVEAHNFRRAASELESRLAIRAPERPPRLAFDMENAVSKVAQAIHPEKSFPFRLSALVHLPDRTLDKPEEIVDAMTHPDFEDAMYTYLRDINKELLIPNLQLIPPNSISLLETNPRFIESYMVGLNHEMGRELLWREYPTDLRGSYFRQFWEVKGISNPDKSSDAELMKDITKIHTWQPNTWIGSHKPVNPNAEVPTNEKQVVLVIRGELLKRYPNTVIYAQKAFADEQGNDVIHTNDLTPEVFKKEIKFPLFRAEIEPDLRFFGFDLTIEKARGENARGEKVASRDFPGDFRGWFFVIQEVPGEPRFGMDINYEPTRDTDNNPANDPLDTWDNLAWDLFGASEPSFVKRSLHPAFHRKGSPELQNHQWGKSSAEMAYILFQSPVMVAVHAKEMLEETKS